MGIIVIISLKLKFSKSQKQFIETPLPKHQTKYLTKFCPMKLGQNLVKYKKKIRAMEFQEKMLLRFTDLY